MLPPLPIGLAEKQGQIQSRAHSSREEQMAILQTALAREKKPATSPPPIDGAFLPDRFNVFLTRGSGPFDHTRALAFTEGVWHRIIEDLLGAE